MSLGESIRKGTKWLVAGSLAGQVLQFAFGVVLARLLLPADFGLLVTIQVFTGVAGMIASGGMGDALVRAKKVDEHDFNVVFTAQLALSVLIFIAFFTLSPTIALAFNEPLYTDLIRISALSFLFRPMLNARNIWLQREMLFKERSLAGLSCAIFSGALSIIMAWAGMGVWSLILSGLAGSLLNLILLDRITLQRLQMSFDIGTARIHSGYGLKSSANELVSYLRKQTSNLIISHVAGPASVGLYNKAESLAMLPLATISDAVYTPVFRAMSKVQDDAAQVRYLFYRMISLLVVYTLPFYVGLAWLAEPFIGVVYGENWLPVAGPLTVISLCGFLFCIGHPCGAVLAARNLLGREVLIQAATWAFVAVATLIGLRWGGLTGIAWGVAASHLFSASLMYHLASKSVQGSLRELINAIAPGLLFNALMLAVLWGLDLLLPSGFPEQQQAAYLLLSATVGGLIYGASFLFLPIPSLEAEALRWRKTLCLA
ncbi:polysaccharide biosynthesis protein [Sulfuricella sp. T08]|uniref:lipopolysaccharide biosynthesis protein n=1 Tax=Sulfuricella sp. T08 TaxID=1632857 RepID=UPI0006179C54|nr:lipopolysaccharide biosynthesis protein [Sulfuricella sp. T08]GAO34884.1 polysaccharide biosynthesis protein [Sulfuricella sp. T08]